jgi:hypothetical protein
MVSRFDGAVASVVVHIHAAVFPHAAAVVSRFSDLDAKAATIELAGYADQSATAGRGLS